MRLAQEANGKGEFFQRADGVVHGADVVLHLRPVVAVLGFEILGFLEGVLDVRLSPLDPTGLRGLLGDMHPDKKIDVRDQLGKRIEFSQCTIRTPEQVGQLRIRDFPLMANGRWQKCLVFEPLLVSARLKVGNVHYVTNRQVSDITS